MAQQHTPLSIAPKRARQITNWWLDLSLILAIVGAAYGLVRIAALWTAPMTPAVAVDLSPSRLPYYAALSTFRMFLAYVLSLVFSIVYARLAASSRAAERFMVPALDLLQSIPILSFMPGVVLGLIALFPRSQVGLELAAIVLIFTSQVWNMAFSFHQSLTTVPSELIEVATSFRLGFWRRFTRLEIPFGTISLVWNSMMSWAGGWFFLMAAEQFTLGDHDFRLPGLGSYLRGAADAGEVSTLLLGLLMLVVVIIMLDVLIWRPLIAWSDRFRFEQTEADTQPRSAVLDGLRASPALNWLGETVAVPLREKVDYLLGGTPARDAAVAPASTPRRALPQQAWRWLLLLILAVAAGWGVVAAYQMLIELDATEWRQIFSGGIATFLRTIAALAIATAWTVPVGVAIGSNPRWAQRAQPIVQIVASIPATALFPALLLLFLDLPGGLNVAAILLMLLGTQWYVLFNVIAGAMAIPTDLRETAAMYKLRGWHRWRYLILPAIFPYLVTGLITAMGGAWNASVVSEYITFGGARFGTVGLGSLIAIAAEAGNFPLLLAATLAMAGTVVAINRLVWRRLYTLAERRFRLG